jgi:hypothetical protein
MWVRGNPIYLRRGQRMKHRRIVIAVLAAVFVVFGATQVIARGHDITGYPKRINRVDLDGYVLQTSYTLGVNEGNTFEQTYLPDGKFSAVCVSGPFAPCAGTGNYVAMPVGHKQLMVTWYTDTGVLADVFVFNFKSHVVSDVAPGVTPPGSLGTVEILERGSARIP